MKQISTFQYIPSFIYKEGSKYKQLTEEYEECFLKYVQEGDIEDRYKFFLGIDHVAKYVYSSFLYGVNSDYDSKSPQDRVVYAIFFRYSSYIGGVDTALEELREKLVDLAFSAVYYALGIEQYKKRNFKWNGEGNFIKYVIKKVYSFLLFDFFRSIEYELNHEAIFENSESTDLDLIEYISNKKMLPYLVKERVIKYLSGDTSIKTLKELDIKYLTEIYREIQK